MAISQKGATYEGRAGIENPPTSLREFAKHVLRAMDDLASQSAAIRTQGNFGVSGPPEAPPALVSLSVTAQDGIFDVSVIPNQAAPAGTEHFADYSTTPNFQNFTTVPLTAPQGAARWRGALGNQTLYWRAYSKLPASAPSKFIYFGGPTNPNPISGGGATTGPGPQNSAGTPKPSGAPGGSSHGKGPLL